MKHLLYIFIILTLLTGAFVFYAYGASEGPNSPGTVVDDDTVGTKAWSNPGNATASDDNYAYAGGDSGVPGTQKFHYLKATDFGFSIPDGATIDGIKVEIERGANFDSDSRNVVDNEVKIVKSDGTIGTENKADTVTRWPGTDTYVSYGSPSDLWNETWSPSDINDIDFGMVLSPDVTKTDENPGQTIGRVDHIRITVYYSEATDNNVKLQSGTIKVNGGTLKIQ